MHGGARGLTNCEKCICMKSISIVDAGFVDVLDTPLHLRFSTTPEVGLSSQDAASCLSNVINRLNDVDIKEQRARDSHVYPVWYPYGGTGGPSALAWT